MAKANIHPSYQNATITCACGASYESASTRGSFTVEICARCHPFYTDKQKLVDAAGRIDRFNKRYQLQPGAVGGAVKIESKKAEAPKPAKSEKTEKTEKKVEAPKPEKADKSDKKTDKPGKSEPKPKA